MRFFGLLSRLWASNPVKSRGNPPNCGAIHHNHDCEGFRNPTQSKGFSHNQWGLQADCVRGLNTNAEQDNAAINGIMCVQTWFEPWRSMYNQNSQNWMFLYFAIRSQSNFHSLQSAPIVAGFQDCRMWLENWKSSVLDCYKILQNSYVIAMGFSGCSDMPCCKILG